MAQRTAPGVAGERWLREMRGAQGELVGLWQAGVWVRERDGRRRCIRVRRPTRAEAATALDAQLERRIGRGVCGVTAEMTVAELAEHWLASRIAQAHVPSAGPRGGQGGPVAPQTLAGYQSVIDRVIVPSLGGLLPSEVRVGILDEALAAVAAQGRSAGMTHTVLKQMFALAVRHDVLASNPMREIDRPRRRRSPVHRLTVEQVHDLLAVAESYTVGHCIDEHGRRTGGRPRSPVLRDMIVFMLATGCRIGEALAVTWRDLDLDGDRPMVTVAATLIEPRKQTLPGGRDGRVGQVGVAPPPRVFVEKMHRQPVTKSGSERTLILPDAAVAVLHQRRRARPTKHLDAPVFMSATGGWLSPANQRTKLRAMTAGTEFEGVSPHVLRRTVGTHLAHEAGLDVAREVLGHADTSVTWRHYVAPRQLGPDVRTLLDAFFTRPQ